jgi:prepilin-type N-terminal cleavage/methylation domain-containing protein
MSNVLTRARAGFTLVELMIVIAIAAVLMAVVFPIAHGISFSNKRSQCASNLNSLGDSLLSLRDDYGGFPRDRFEIDPNDPDTPPGIGIIDTPGWPGVVGLYALYYLTEYVGEYTSRQTFSGSGTATFTNASVTVNGIGTSWQSDHQIAPGDQIQPDSVGTWPGPVIAAIVNDTQLTLSAAYTGATETGAAYSILKVTSLNNQPWFTGGRYTRNLSFFHCPSNPTATAVEDAPPLLGGYNNCDLYYCRNWFDFDTYPYPETPSDPRNLLQQFPPADTLVTFCPYHRVSQDFLVGHPDKGDMDEVLFADGSVLGLAAYPYDLSYYITGSGSPPAENPAAYFSRMRAGQSD